MPVITDNSRNSLDSLISSVLEAEAKTNSQLKEAVKNNAPVSEKARLVDAAVQLSDELQRLNDLELDYKASAKGISQAEKELAQGAQDARRHVKSMNSVANVVQGAADVASVIARLLAIF